jgi:hypothetical protein
VKDSGAKLRRYSLHSAYRLRTHRQSSIFTGTSLQVRPSVLSRREASIGASRLGTREKNQHGYLNHSVRAISKHGSVSRGSGTAVVIGDVTD